MIIVQRLLWLVPALVCQVGLAQIIPFVPFTDNSTVNSDSNNNNQLFSPPTLSPDCTPTDTLPNWVIHKFPESGYSEYPIYIDVLNDSIIWVVGRRKDTIANTTRTKWFKSLDGGCSWESGLLSVGCIPVAICARNDTSVFVTRFNGCYVYVDSLQQYQQHYVPILRTNDGGQSWSNPMPPGAFTLPGAFANFVHFFDQENGVICGDLTDGYFEIYVTSDGGDTWTRIPAANLPDPLNDVAFLGRLYSVQGDTIWAPTSHGRIYRSTNKGLNWTYSEPLPPGTVDVLGMRIAFRDALNGIFYSSDYGTWRTSDGGQTWVEIKNPPTDNVFALDAIPGSNVYLLSGSHAYLSVDDGQSWHFLGTGLTDPVDFVSPEIGWAVIRKAPYSEMGKWRAKRIIPFQQKPHIAMTTPRQATPFNRDITYVRLRSPGADVRTDWIITRDGLPFLTHSETIFLPHNGQDTVNYEFLPTVTGRYEIITQTIDLADSSLVYTNKSRLLVTDTLISKGDIEGDTLIWYQYSGAFGTQLSLIQKDTMTGMSLWFQGAPPGEPADCEIKYSVYGFLPGSTIPDLLLYETPVYPLTDSDVNTWAFVPFDTPLILDSGKYVIAADAWIPNGGARSFGTSLDQQDTTHWVKYIYWEQYYAFGSYALRAHFNTKISTAAKIPEEHPLAIGVTPNPTNGPLTVSADFEKVTDLHLQVFDATGKLVLEKNTIAPSGPWKETFDLSFFPAGVYYVKIIEGSKVWNRNVVKN